MTTNEYLDLLDRSVQVAYDPLAMTIKFMDKEIPILTVDNKVHKVNEDFNRALSKMPYDKPSYGLYFIESDHVHVYLKRLLVRERRRKLKMLVKA